MGQVFIHTQVHVLQAKCKIPFLNNSTTALLSLLYVGKIGTDIQEGKCTWLLVETITRADEETKKQLVSSYGRNEPDAVAAVKEIYTRLGMPSVFESKVEKKTMYAI